MICDPPLILNGAWMAREAADAVRSPISAPWEKTALWIVSALFCKKLHRGKTFRHLIDNETQ